MVQKRKTLKTAAMFMVLIAIIGITIIKTDAIGLQIIKVYAQDEISTTTVPEAETKKQTKPVKKIRLSRTKVKIKKSVEHKVKLSWKKVNNAQYYYVYRSAKKKSGYKLLAKVNTTYCTDKKAKKRKKYYYKVVSAAKVKGKEIKSKSSKPKSTYVYPKKPVRVITGECYAEALHLWAKDELPAKVKFVQKIGLSTYGMLNSNNFKYKKQSVTAIERVALYHPDRVYFLVGMNEAVTDYTQPTINRLTQMINLLKKVNPHVEVVLLAIPPLAVKVVDISPTTAQKKAFNDAYKKLAESQKNVYYYDYTSEMVDKKGHLKKEYDAGDGSHWTVAAAQLVAGKITAFDKTLNKKH